MKQSDAFVDLNEKSLEKSSSQQKKTNPICLDIV